MKSETQKLVEKSNRLAALVREKRDEKNRRLEEWSQLSRKESEIERQVIDGDHALVPQWIEVTRNRRDADGWYLRDAVNFDALLKEYRDARTAAINAVLADAGLETTSEY